MFFRLITCGLWATLVFADIVTISPASLDFGSLVVGPSNIVDSQSVILNNSTKKILNISSIVTTGNFVVQGTNPCGPSLAPGAQCTFSIQFLPQSVGPQTGVLSVNDDANSTPQKVRLSGTGIPVTLTSISVTPNLSTIPLGLTQQFVATGFYNNNLSSDITQTVTWSASLSSVIIINSTGLATGLAQGTATVTASAAGVSGSASSKVGPPVLVSMSVSPAAAPVKKGTSLQLAATGTNSDGSTVDLTASSQWTSLASSIATVTSAGLVSALSPGTATIQATSANVTGKATISVPQPVVISDTLLPRSIFIPLGSSQQFSCQLTYDDGSTSILTSPSLVWVSSSPSTCSIDSTGLATCAGVGSVTISTNLCNQTTSRLDSAVTEPRNNMGSPRVTHTAVVLPDGRALITGGSTQLLGAPLASADLYDPSTNTFSSTGSMSTPRSNHTATLLPNGKVLIAGGASTSGPASTAELYDPATGAFAATGNLNFARQGHSATLLANGTVLIAGGGVLPAEIYDPVAGSFTQTGSMSVQRVQGTATLLSNGKVLFAGGVPAAPLATAEVFDPASGTFSQTGSMTSARADHSAVLLNDGTVFIAGGYDGTVSLASTEIYNPVTGSFTPSGSLSMGRDSHTAILLPTGKVLLSGGENRGSLSSGELFDPIAGASFMSGILGTLHYPGPGVGHTASLLNTGQVLITGGTAPAVMSLSGAELFVPQP